MQSLGYWDIEKVGNYDCTTSEIAVQIGNLGEGTGAVEVYVFGNPYASTINEYTRGVPFHPTVCDYFDDWEPFWVPGVAGSGPNGDPDYDSFFGGSSNPNVPVVKPAVTLSGMTFSSSDITMDPGQSAALSTELFYSDGSHVIRDLGIPFVSSNTFAVTASGHTIFAVGSGESTVSVNYAAFGLSAAAAVHVVASIDSMETFVHDTLNCATDTLRLIPPPGNAGDWAYCRGTRPGPSDSVRIRTAIDSIKARGGVCATLGAVVDSIFAAGRIHLAPLASFHHTSAAPGGEHASGYIVLADLTTSDAADHFDVSGHWLTLAAVLVHETDHLVGNVPASGLAALDGIHVSGSDLTATVNSKACSGTVGKP